MARQQIQLSAQGHLSIYVDNPVPVQELEEAIKSPHAITVVKICVQSSRNCTPEQFLTVVRMAISIPITKLTIDINGLGSYDLDRKIMEVVKTSTSIVDFNITYNTFKIPLGSFVSYVPEDFDYYRPDFDPVVFATIKEMLERNRALVGITRRVPSPDEPYEYEEDQRVTIGCTD